MCSQAENHCYSDQMLSVLVFLTPFCLSQAESSVRVGGLMAHGSRLTAGDLASAQCLAP